MAAEKTFLALDVGQSRIGVARANAIAQLPEPLNHLKNDEHIWDNISEIIKQQDVGMIIIGLPRNLDGRETGQSAEIRQFATQLKSKFDIPIEFADETLSSKRADEYIKTHKLSSTDQDSVAACFILNEYLIK